MNSPVAAIVVAYHPDAQTFERNLRRYACAVDKVLVWRNSPEKIDLPADVLEKVVWCGRGCNDFMAQPLNFALKWCEKNNYPWLLTMDQDSLWENCADFVAEALRRSGADVAVFAPNVNHLHAEAEEPKEVESVITSGSLVNVKVALRLGGFREDYKIYWVDGEFCHRARLAAYRIIVLTRRHLAQSFGHETKTRLGFIAAHYSAEVYYYLFRNMLWMRREYRTTPSLKCVAYTTLFYVRGIIFGEKEKRRKLSAILRAWRDGLFRSFEPAGANFSRLAVGERNEKNEKND